MGRLTPAGDGGGDGYEFAYTPEVVETVEEGTALLSHGLGVRDEPYGHAASRPYFEGLLPHGRRRQQTAAELELEPDDTLGLLGALGADCLGAVTLLPQGEPVPPVAAGERPIPVSEEELEELVEAPPPRYFELGREHRMRLALPGLRHKLALVRDEAADGGWAWPSHGAPSTHVVKPENGTHPEIVVNEAFCLAVLREMGFWAVAAEVEEITGLRCLVSARFDRGRQPGRPAARLHAENFSQALGGEPGFAAASALLREAGEAESVTVLLGLEICNYLLGNGDAHPDNLALLHSHEGPMQAPFHDVASTAVYDDPLHCGLTIAPGPFEQATKADLLAAGHQCGIAPDKTARIAANMSLMTIDALDVVAERARTERWHEPVVDEVVALARTRADGVLRAVS